MKDRDKTLYDLDMGGYSITEDDRDACAGRLHRCPEWDYAAIDNDCEEMEACLCNLPQDKRTKTVDLLDE